jgi:hypothetical protein
MAKKKKTEVTEVISPVPHEEEQVTHTRSEFDAIVAQSFNNGVQDGIQKMKDHVVTLVQGHATNLFLANQDELAKEVRKILAHLKSINS